MLRTSIMTAALMLSATASLAQTTEVSVTFEAGLIGRFGNNTGQADTVVNTGNVGITSATFSQQSDNGKFGGTQGNDYCGTLKLNGPDISFAACVNWRITAGNFTHYVGFVPDKDANVSPDADGITLIYSGTLAGFSDGYKLVIDSSIANEAPENNFAFRTNASAPSYADGDDASGNAASSSALESLNAYLAAQSDATLPEISGPNQTTLDGEGADETEVEAGAKDVTVFTATEDVIWSIEGDTDNLFAISETGALTFRNPAVYDPDDPANNVHVISVVAKDAAGNEAFMSFTVTVTPATPDANIQGPSGQAGDESSEKTVQAGTTAVHQFSALDGNGAAIDGAWSIREHDADLFAIDPDTGALSFLVAPSFIPGGDNTYQVLVVFTYGDAEEVVQLVTIEVLDTPSEALARSREDVEKIIVDTEIAKLRGQQTFLRSITSSARGRLASGSCDGIAKDDTAAAPDQIQDCTLRDHDLQIGADGSGTTLKGHDRTILSFDGYRRITNLDLSVLDQGELRTLSFNGYFGLESVRHEHALYGIFTGVSVNKSDVNRALSGSTDAYGISLGAYAVHELRQDLFSELYVSIGRSQNQLDLTDGSLDVAADYGTTETHLGWILSGKIENGQWDILPEAAVQLARSASSSVEVTGETSDGLATATWEGLTATLARADISTEFRYYLDGRADDAWVLGATPGIVCERVSAISVTSGCGLSVSLGLDRVSTDGAQRISAKLGAEEIEGVRRKSAALSYELRF